MVALSEVGDGITEADDLKAQNNSQRRRRYIRTPINMSLVTLTPTKAQLLRFLADCQFLSLPQLARLCCPSEKSARRHMRDLFDAGLVDVLPVSRLALAPLDAPNDATLLYGSAPNLYVPTVRGLELLYGVGLIEKEMVKRPALAYGPKNSLFLSHELGVRDVRVWLEMASQASHGEQQVMSWRDGKDAILHMKNGGCVRPDAWFVYRVGQREGKPTVLVGLVEVDRGTERGEKRWKEKLDDYNMLFSNNELKAATGYINARVLVTVPNARRRHQLAEFIETYCETVAGRFWLAECRVLQARDLAVPYWQQGGLIGLRALVPLHAPASNT